MIRPPIEDEPLIGLPTKQIWLNLRHITTPTVGTDWVPAELTNTEWARTHFEIPWNFHGFVRWDLIMYCTINSLVHRVQPRIDAGQCNEAWNTHSQARNWDNNFTANQYLCLDLVNVLTTVIPLLTVGDIVRFSVQNRNANRLHIVGCDVRYI